MGHWNEAGYSYEKGFKTMELSIETLQGPPFELRVSALDTIADVKARIYKRQGIPISQQHLVWNSSELDDDYCLQDYDIQDGSTLKLVPTMRVGPINTRRIPIEEPSLRDYADYLSDANREEIYDKISSSARPLTVIVYQNGDQINFFRIVDREATSPLSESLSNASMYGMCEEEEEEEEQEASREKTEEHDRMQVKVKQLRTRMDQTKKPKTTSKKVHLPHPPTSGRASGRASGRPRLQRLSSSASRHNLFNKNTCLPPVGGSASGRGSATASGRGSATASGRGSAELGDIKKTESSAEGMDGSVIESNRVDKIPSGAVLNEASSVSLSSAKGVSLPVKPSGSSLPGSASKIRKPLESATTESAKLSRLTSVLEDETVEPEVGTKGASASTLLSAKSPRRPSNDIEALERILKQAQVPVRKKTPRFSQDLLLKDSSSLGAKTTSRPTTSSRLGKDPPSASSASTSYTYKEPKSGRKSRGGLDRLLSDPSGSEAYGAGAPTTAATLEALKESLGHPPSTASTKRSKGGVILESLNPSEVRAMSGMLNSFVNSASKSRTGFIKDGRIPTPESRLMSARFRMSAGRDGHTTPSHRLPPVKQKKKASKRCALCNKKTGLANSYMCRCGNNFCATHRYAESHECSFDYKTEGRKILEQANPVVTAPKLPKI